MASVEEEVKKALCQYFPTECQKAAGLSLDEIRRQSAGAVNWLAKQPWYGPVLAETLVGAKDPGAMAKEVQAMARNFSSNINEQSVYKFFYGQARSALELADQALSKYPEVAAAHRFIGEQEKLYIEGKSVAQVMGDSGIDPAAIGDAMNVLRRGVSSAQGLARAFGVDEGSTADEVMDWAGVTLGCGAAIATGVAAGGVGVVGGAVACAVTVLTKVFDVLSSKAPEGPDLGSTKWAIFRPLGQEQQAMIAADAARLSSLLRYRYGVPSWEKFTAGLNRKSQEGDRQSGFWASNHPQYFSPATAKSLLVPGMYGAHGVGKAATGFTTRNVLDLLELYYLPNPGMWQQIAYGFGKQGNFWNWKAFAQDNKQLVLGDVPVVTLMQMAPHLAKNPTFVDPNCVANCYPYAPKLFTPIRVYAELINFFAAVTKQELLTNPSALIPWKAGLPVTFQFTKLDGETWSEQSPRRDIFELLGAVSQQNADALREFANLRLLAAMSYINMSYHWSSPRATGVNVLTAKKDIIKELPNLDCNDPTSRLRCPVDPKTKNGVMPSIGTLHARIVADSEYLANIAEQARDDAWDQTTKIVKLNITKQQELMRRYGDPSARQGQMIDMASLVERGILKPTETPGWTFVPGKGWMPSGTADDTTDTTSKGISPVAVVGAAALLGLFLLRR